MRALLVRHGEAIDPHLAPSDDERWLTEVGRATAARVGQKLVELGVAPTRFVASPLVRAVQTSEILAGATDHRGAIHVSRLLVPQGTTVARMISLLDGATESDTVCLVGHEPSIRVLTAKLAGIEPLFSFRTAGSCLLERTENGSFRFVWMLDPRTLTLAESVAALTP